MDQKFIQLSALATKPGKPGRLPVTKVTIWRWVKLGEFPKPVKLGEATTAWKISEIEEWEAGLNYTKRSSLPPTRSSEKDAK